MVATVGRNVLLVREGSGLHHCLLLDAHNCKAHRILSVHIATNIFCTIFTELLSPKSAGLSCWLWLSVFLGRA